MLVSIRIGTTPHSANNLTLAKSEAARVSTYCVNFLFQRFCHSLLLPRMQVCSTAQIPSGPVGLQLLREFSLCMRLGPFVITTEFCVKIQSGSTWASSRIQPTIFASPRLLHYRACSASKVCQIRALPSQMRRLEVVRLYNRSQFVAGPVSEMHGGAGSTNFVDPASSWARRSDDMRGLSVIIQALLLRFQPSNQLSRGRSLGLHCSKGVFGFFYDIYFAATDMSDLIISPYCFALTLDILNPYGRVRSKVSGGPKRRSFDLQRANLSSFASRSASIPASRRSPSSPINEQYLFSCLLRIRRCSYP